MSTIIVSSLPDVWVQHQNWMTNVIDNQKKVAPNSKMNYIQLGNRSTNLQNNLLFFIVGAGFGVSYSMTKINVLDWNRTSWPKKAIRMIIAGAVQSGIYYLFEYFIIISRNGAETFFYKASCRLLQGYLV